MILNIFLCVLATCVLSLEKCLCRYCAQFLFLYWALWALCIFLKLTPCWLHGLQIFSLNLWLSFHSLDCFLCCAKVFCLIRLFLFIFAFIYFILGRGDLAKKLLLWFMSENMSKIYVIWHDQLKGQEYEQILEDSEGQRSLACCSPWSHKESDMT